MVGAGGESCSGFSARHIGCLFGSTGQFELLTCGWNGWGFADRSVSAEVLTENSLARFSSS